MRFPNAAKGINKIFTSEIVSLIATVASGVTSILAILFIEAESVGSETVAVAPAIGVLAFGIGGLVLMFIAFIFQLVGVIQASKDEGFFKIVIYLTLAGMLLTAIAQCFITTNTIVYNICETVALVLDIIGSLFMILGISSLASQYENNAIVEKCGTLFRVILWIAIVALISKFCSIFINSSSARAIIAVFSVIALILNITQYVLYIMILARTKKMLAESTEDSK